MSQTAEPVATAGGLTSLELPVARLEADVAHIQWVIRRMLSAYLLLIAALVAVVGYAPRLQAFFGTAPASGGFALPR